MCGIAGYIGRNIIAEDTLRTALGLMKNRGPDHQAFCVFEEQDNRVYLLHSRLSIIDLDERSHQPFTIGDVSIVFNGEIYNYLELRAELEKKGIIFRTSSDTEVLLQCYRQYGEQCVERFEGMWSFAIYDSRSKKLFLSRDRFAEKPLYYRVTRDGIYFGSEIKFIRSLSLVPLVVNERHLLRYLVNGYKALYKTSDTFFEDVGYLPYATNMTINKDLDIHMQRYWSPVFAERQMSLEESIEGTRYWLRESVKIRLRSDVPLAFCLSGGVDSASLASIAAKEFGCNVKTFSIVDSDERYNEYHNIKATIDDLDCEHTIIEISSDNIFDRLTKLVMYHDSPVSTISYFVHSFLSEAISEGGFRVAMSGTAADELFTGYYDHFNLHLYEMRNAHDYPELLRDWERHIGPIVRNPYLKNHRLYFENQAIRDHIYLENDVFAGYLKEGFKEAFAEEDYCPSLLRNRMLNELFHESIPVILQEDDLNSMFYSVENRSPYLDSRLFNFAYSVPVRYLIRNGYGKNVLREAMSGILNEQVRTDRKKVGFNASINSIIDFRNKEVREYLLEDSKVFDLVKRERIEEAMCNKLMPNSYSKFMFNFINSKIFLEVQDRS